LRRDTNSSKSATTIILAIYKQAQSSGPSKLSEGNALTFNPYLHLGNPRTHQTLQTT